jgi:hypothetical protein
MLNTKLDFAALATAVLAALSGSAFAVPVFVSGSATITHQGNLGGLNDVRTLTVPTLPVFNNTTYQYQATSGNAITNGTASSSARVGVGYIIGPNYLGLAIPSGTNLTQRGNTNPAASTASSLQVDFVARFRIEGSNFGPAMAGASFGLAGSIPTGGNAFTELSISSSFTYIPVGGEATFLRGPINPNPFFRRTTPGTFVFSLADMADTLPRTLFVGDEVEINGFIRFRVHNDDGEATLETNEVSGFVPAPGSAGLLLLGGVFASRRRRV